MKTGFTRRGFMAGTTAGLTGIMACSSISCRTISDCFGCSSGVSTETFAREVKRILPEESIFAYHKHLSKAPVHLQNRRDRTIGVESNELLIDDSGWTLVWLDNGSEVVKTAIADFQDYMKCSMGVTVDVKTAKALTDAVKQGKTIVAGTAAQLPEFGKTLKRSKDYELSVADSTIVVCGFDDRGVMYGLYNLEARMNLREAPILPAKLSIVRHSLYDVRMVHSWMGWMEWPDTLLAHMAHDGIDGIYCSVYANPNGDRTTSETSTDWYARGMHNIRQQDPARIKSLIKRAAKHGIKVYTPIIHLYTGTPENEEQLRKLTRDIVTEFPEIQGYVLLIEGFWYKKWGGWREGDDEQKKDWARNWMKSVKIVMEECHKINPAIEILPWDYNIPASPGNVEIKSYYADLFPEGSTPLMTWEKGCGYKLDDMQGHLTDYSLCQVGPAEVTKAQMDKIRSRNMKFYTKVDTFASWQYGTSPYLPFPNQWHTRYKALAEHGVYGTMESWSSGYSPSFITELRAWTCWTNDPSLDELLNSIAQRIFGSKGKANAIEAWRIFSQAIRLVPDTGAYMGTNHAVANPLFFQEQPNRTATYQYSWRQYNRYSGSPRCGLNPQWPFTNTRMVFCPDFDNRVNRAEGYARQCTGIRPKEKGKRVLPSFLKYMHMAADHMEEGLQLYRAAALTAPAHKKQGAVREVVVAEQLHRMMLSDCAILEFEELRFSFVHEKDKSKALALLSQMEAIACDELQRTKLSLLAATRDSRLGFQYEQDYVYTPYSLSEKIKMLEKTLQQELPAARKGR